MPRVAGIQASGCAPLIRGRPIREPHTLATAIECGDPLDGKRALGAVRESRGFLEMVTDREILKARDLLARREGIFAEPAGAAALAGVIKARKGIRGDAVCLVTGHGLKAPYGRGRVREMEIKSFGWDSQQHRRRFSKGARPLELGRFF
jgi:threonine synthase